MMKGWSTNGPARYYPSADTGWIEVPQASGTHEGLGKDSGLIKAKINVAESGLGKGEAASALRFLYNQDEAYGQDKQSLFIPRFQITDSGLAEDYSRLGLLGRDEGVALDLTTLKSSQSVSDLSSAIDAISTFRAAELLLESALAEEGGSAAFRPPEGLPWVAQFTSNWNLTIPVWSKYIDVIILASGGGGAGGNSFGGDGKGGNAGGWAYAVLTRGGNILWTDTTITGTIGAGGSSGSRGNGSGGTGANATANLPQLGLITAFGGTGGSGINGVGATDYYGKSPYTYTVNGADYEGGSVQTSKTSAGNAPGGGASGGAGGVFGSDKAGGVGAIGKAWVRMYV